jgi:YVTN family beta-propeller protein
VYWVWRNLDPRANVADAERGDQSIDRLQYVRLERGDNQMRTQMNGRPYRWAIRSSGLALLLAMIGAIEAEAAPFAYVANFSSGTVSVIDTATNVLVTTVPVGGNPHGVAITPDGAFAYVTTDVFRALNENS